MKNMVGKCWAVNDHVLMLKNLVGGIALQGGDEVRDAHAGRGSGGQVGEGL